MEGSPHDVMVGNMFIPLILGYGAQDTPKEIVHEIFGEIEQYSRQLDHMDRLWKEYNP